MCPTNVEPESTVPPIISDDDLVGKTGEAALICGAVFATGRGGTKSEIRAVLLERGFGESKSTWARVWGEMLERKILANVKGTQSWRYVPLDKRAELLEPIDPLDDSGQTGFYAE